MKIDQKVLFVDQCNKAPLLIDILQDRSVRRALVFTRTKHRADRLMRHLVGKGIPADAIHSNRSQTRRQRSLANFDRGRIRVLVATDVVARGIDVEGISHVINYELPNGVESYVHRVGRTARAGAARIALSFCEATEVLIVKAIEKVWGGRDDEYQDVIDNPEYKPMLVIAVIKPQNLSLEAPVLTGPD